jgi:hypothetical protein
VVVSLDGGVYVCVGYAGGRLDSSNILRIKIETREKVWWKEKYIRSSHAYI